MRGISNLGEMFSEVSAQVSLILITFENVYAVILWESLTHFRGKNVVAGCCNTNFYYEVE